MSKQEKAVKKRFKYRRKEGKGEDMNPLVYLSFVVSSAVSEGRPWDACLIRVFSGSFSILRVRLFSALWLRLPDLLSRQENSYASTPPPEEENA
jgi:hypothetical protein